MIEANLISGCSKELQPFVIIKSSDALSEVECFENIDPETISGFYSDKQTRYRREPEMAFLIPILSEKV